jgi:N-acetylglucosaminyldiphosphoundecaprenol N-acetyl-beta-D-mannosaminyltransferase
MALVEPLRKLSSLSYLNNMTGRVNLLGVTVNAVDLPTTLDAMSEQIAQKTKGYICLAPAHNLMAGRADKELRAIFNASTLTVPDGMGTVWFLRLLGYRAERVYGPDLMLAVCRRGAEAGWRHYFVGGAPGVAEKLALRLRSEIHNLTIAGIYTPPFREMNVEEIDSMVEQINGAKPDIVWVGLGSPKQERWMAEYRPRLTAPLQIGVGAAFDFLSGAKPQAPRWMQRAGSEWLFRLFSEPRRLWRRYAAYPLFVALALAQRARLTHYPLEGNR